jgi:hypothetical protein
MVLQLDYVGTPATQHQENPLRLEQGVPVLGIRSSLNEA